MARVKNKDTYTPTTTDIANGERLLGLMPHTLYWQHMKTGVHAYIPVERMDEFGLTEQRLRNSASLQRHAYYVFFIHVRRPSGAPAGLLIAARQATLPLPKYLQRAEAEGYTLDEERLDDI